MRLLRRFSLGLTLDSILVGAVVGGAACAYVLYRGMSSPIASDFDQLWYAARGVLRGVSPYDVVGPGREFSWDYLFYPMPAVVLAIPFALLPLLAARAGVAAISAFLLSAALWRHDRGRLFAFASAPMFIALGRGQASPLILATAFIPVLSWLGAIKPNIAVAVLPLSRDVRATMIAGAVGSALLLAISFALEPSWVAEWRDALSRKNDSAPIIVRSGGVLVLLALLQWRRREAWLVLLLACLPQTPSLYDAVPLFAVPYGARQTSFLAVCGNLAFLALVSGLGFPSGASYGVRVTTLCLLLIYLPCIALLLAKPNAARLPEADGERRSRLDAPLFAALAISTFFALWGTVAKYRV